MLLLAVIAAGGSVLISPEVSLATDRVVLAFWGAVLALFLAVLTQRRAAGLLSAWLPPLIGLVLAVAFVQVDGADADSRLSAQTLLLLLFACWLFHALWVGGQTGVGPMILAGATTAGWAYWLHTGMTLQGNGLWAVAAFLFVGLGLPSFFGLMCHSRGKSRQEGRK